MKSRKFLMVLVATVFCLANLFSYLRMPAESYLLDGFVTFGWPFDVYGYGGYWTHHFLIWTGIIANVFLAFCFYQIARRLLRL
jgi:hypothetical protein